jgi:hypothetical protein
VHFSGPSRKRDVPNAPRNTRNTSDIGVARLHRRDGGPKGLRGWRCHMTYNQPRQVHRIVLAVRSSGILHASDKLSISMLTRTAVRRLPHTGHAQTGSRRPAVHVNTQKERPAQALPGGS